MDETRLRMRVVSVGYEAEGGSRFITDDDEREARFEVVLASTEGELPGYGEMKFQVSRALVERYTLGTIVEVTMLAHDARKSLMGKVARFREARAAYDECADLLQTTDAAIRQAKLAQETMTELALKLAQETMTEVALEIAEAITGT
jgi:hypothetical protein